MGGLSFPNLSADPLTGILGFRGGGGESLIDERILAAAAASIVFTNIPQQYRELRLKYSLRGDNAGDQALLVQFNLDVAALYDQEVLTINNITATAVGAAAGTSIKAGLIPGTASPANHFEHGEITIPDYQLKINRKVLFSRSYHENAETAAGQNHLLDSGLWRTANAPITTITLLPAAGNFIAASSIQLFGKY